MRFLVIFSKIIFYQKLFLITAINSGYIVYLSYSTCKKWEVSDTNVQGHWPIFLTEFGRILHILADYRNRNTAGHRNLDKYLKDIVE